MITCHYHIQQCAADRKKSNARPEAHGNVPTRRSALDQPPTDRILHLLVNPQRIDEISIN
jgi:hypothetical protein